MGLQVGPGVLQRMDDNGDHALTDEMFQKNQDGTSWSRTLGTKGWYYASEGHQKGNWEVVGPFEVAG